MYHLRQTREKVAASTGRQEMAIETRLQLRTERDLGCSNIQTVYCLISGSSIYPVPTEK